MRDKRRFREELNPDRNCSAESCHVMTSTSEKSTNEEVDEIAQWRDVDVIPKSTIVTTSRSGSVDVGNHKAAADCLRCMVGRR